MGLKSKFVKFFAQRKTYLGELLQRQIVHYLVISGGSLIFQLDYLRCNFLNLAIFKYEIIRTSINQDDITGIQTYFKKIAN